jgi:hypothetical protein
MIVESFANSLYFGSFLRKKKSLRCTVTNLLLLEVVDINGTVNMEYLDRAEKGDLWIYLYYIWSNNRHNSIFKKAQLFSHNRLNGSDLIKFVKSFQTGADNYSFLKKQNIAIACNTLINDEEIHVPIIRETLIVLENLFTKQEKSLETRLSQIDPSLKMYSLNN